MVLIIDRFEGEWAVLEWDGRTFNFPRALIPRGAREGHVLKVSVEIDRAETERRRQRIKELEDRLFQG